MGIRQTLTRFGLGLACAALPAFASGCHTTRKIGTQMADVFEGAPQPATSIGCMWKKQIAHLPDPTRDGVLGAGITGVMNLYAADGQPTKSDGDLQIMAHDETPRAAGQPACKPSMWHFDPATLKKLRTKDDRGLECCVLFLPWPQDWKDVTKVRLQVKYTPRGEGSTSVFTPDQVMAFEAENQPGQSGLTQASTATSRKPLIGDKQGIPDLKKTLDFAKGIAPAPAAPAKPAVEAVAIPTQPVVVQTSHMVPAMPTAPTTAIQLPPNTEPIVSPEPVPMARPTPPPPPMMPKDLPATPVVPRKETVNVTVGEGLPALEIPAAK
jgi:hypothetical protein